MIYTYILIIGAGAVGTAIVRDFSKYHIQVVVVDKRDDEGGDASKSNSSIICTCFDLMLNAFEHELCRTE